MKKQFGRLAVLLIWGTGFGLAVVGYNLWVYNCEGCPADAFFVPGVPELGFLGLTVAAALILAFLKRRRKNTLSRRRCDCDTLLDPGWGYCPLCGSARPAPKH